MVDDLNEMFPDLLKKDVKRSFYGVFDGHGGKKVLIPLVHFPCSLDCVDGLTIALYT